jgi:hypothetical protein
MSSLCRAAQEMTMSVVPFRPAVGTRFAEFCVTYGLGLLLAGTPLLGGLNGHANLFVANLGVALLFSGLGLRWGFGGRDWDLLRYLVPRASHPGRALLLRAVLLFLYATGGFLAGREGLEFGWSVPLGIMLFALIVVLLLQTVALAELWLEAE